MVCAQEVGQNIPRSTIERYVGLFLTWIKICCHPFTKIAQVDCSFPFPHTAPPPYFFLYIFQCSAPLTPQRETRKFKGLGLKITSNVSAQHRLFSSGSHHARTPARCHQPFKLNVGSGRCTGTRIQQSIPRSIH